MLVNKTKIIVKKKLITKIERELNDRYRIYSDKRRGASLNVRASSAALIRGRRRKNSLLV